MERVADDAPVPADLVNCAGQGGGVVVLADVCGGAGGDATCDWLRSLVGGVDHDPVAELAGKLADGADALQNCLVAGLPVQA